MIVILNAKKWICALYGDKSEEEILKHFEVANFSELQVRESNSSTWMIEKKYFDSFIPTDDNDIEKCEEDQDFCIVED